MSEPIPVKRKLFIGVTESMTSFMFHFRSAPADDESNEVAGGYVELEYTGNHPDEFNAFIDEMTKRPN